MLPSTGIVVACVSGGADSMCLLEALLEISGRRGFSLCVAHFNHKLRGEESDRDEEFVRERCFRLGVPFYRGSGDVMEYAAVNGKGVEEAARNLRYDFFSRIATEIGAVRVATAHTSDDNIETMIFNLARGSGTAGLGGIPPMRGLIGQNLRIARQDTGLDSRRSKEDSKLQITESGSPLLIRPMLGVTRDDVMGFISERGLKFVKDSTNDLECFTRNKIRHRIVPVLREINPRACEAAAAAAALARADDEYLCTLADEFIGLAGAYTGEIEAGVSLDAAELANLPVAVSSRVIRRLCNRSLSHIHVKAVLDFCHFSGPSSMLSLPGGSVSREYGRIIFSTEKKLVSKCFEPVHIPLDREIPPRGEFFNAVIPGSGLSVKCAVVTCDVGIIGKINKSFSSFLFKTLDICGRMTVRSRREGDRIRLYGRDCTKTLKKLFIERRIPVSMRPLIPVVSDDEGVLAVYGLGSGDRAVPAPGDTALLICFEDI